MKNRTWVISRYNHGLSWIRDYYKLWEDDLVIYDRSNAFTATEYDKFKDFNFKFVENKGSDIYDKLTWVIDNYDNLPEVAVLIKCNLFDYIKPREFEKIKDNKTFTPILSQEHHTYMPVCFYKDGMYYEQNTMWYLGQHRPKSMQSARELAWLLGISKMDYVPFAPGSGYILPKDNILKHSKDFYIKLRSFLDWDVYPGEAQIMERGLYTLWR